MSNRAAHLQERFLNAVRRSKTPVTLFLLKGVKLQGVITWFDAFSLLLRRDAGSQLVYKHAVSTIQPMRALSDFEAVIPDVDEHSELQDRFLETARREEGEVRLYLMNGVMLEGQIAAHGQFALLLRRDEEMQLVYKHAVSTIQPATELHFGPGEGK